MLATCSTADVEHTLVTTSGMDGTGSLDADHETIKERSRTSTCLKVQQSDETTQVLFFGTLPNTHGCVRTCAVQSAL